MLLFHLLSLDLTKIIILQDSDNESHLDHGDELGAGEPNKPGRKKNPKFVNFRLVLLSMIDHREAHKQRVGTRIV